MDNNSIISDIPELQKIAHELRLDVLEMLHIAGSGHIGGAFGMADIFAALYFGFLAVDPANPADPGRDYCLLSNGHICPIWYSTLAKRGFFSRDELWKLRKIDSLLQGHPKLGIPGVENSSGPLGHGLSQAVGIALAIRMNNVQGTMHNDGSSLAGENGKNNGINGLNVFKSNNSARNQRVVCCMSDGEHQEGQTWEAVMSANKFQLNNLIAIMDHNGLQIEGNTDEIMPLGNLAEKYRSFGWEVQSINGHNFTEILDALSWADSCHGPAMIIAHTVLGRGVSFMENNWAYHDWAGKLGDYEKAIVELKGKS